MADFNVTRKQLVVRNLLYSRAMKGDRSPHISLTSQVETESSWQDLHGAELISFSILSMVTAFHSSIVGISLNGTSYSGIVAVDKRTTSTVSLRKPTNYLFTLAHTSDGIDVVGTSVPFCDTVKLLGVTLDSALSMDQHVTEHRDCLRLQLSHVAHPTITDARCRQDAGTQHCHI